MTINSHAQLSDPGPLVHLFDLDATTIGGGLYRFVNASENGEAILWQGNTYLPLNFEAEGFETNGQGTLPRPRIRVSHINTALLGAVYELGDLLGAIVRRWKTFATYLDEGDTPDPAVYFAPDIYRLERKTAQNRGFIEWELAGALDQEGRKLPGRQILRDTCTHTYRSWDGSAFDYTSATCPYTGSPSFTAAGVSCDEWDDVCGKRLSDCRLRFTYLEPLPTRMFPGVGRSR